MTAYSVLMSVYKNDDANHLKLAVRSMADQTIPPEEIILVRDGEVGEQLQCAIDEIVSSSPGMFTYIPLEKNGGLGNALKIGIEKARNELIARMDSDDISIIDRCEKQLLAFSEDPELDLVGGQVLEFCDEETNNIGERLVPEDDEQIKSLLQSRCPFNHPTVMYKKSSVIKAGNYEEIHFVEDYYLWCKMALRQCKFRNLKEFLVHMRVDDNTYRRRGGKKYFHSIKYLEKFKMQNGIIGRARYIRNITVRFVQCVLLPNKLRSWIYRKFLRQDN